MFPCTKRKETETYFTGALFLFFASNKDNKYSTIVNTKRHATLTAITSRLKEVIECFPGCSHRSYPVIAIPLKMANRINALRFVLR